MKYCNLDTHLIILIAIMIISGAFGGFLNYLHKFDTRADEETHSVTKYILLGIGAAFVIPLFLKMISSDLIRSSDNLDYLIFAGFCLIAAIFSKRFITTIGEQVLERAKNAEKMAKESIRKADNNQLDIATTKERVEDVKLAVDINKLTVDKDNTDTRIFKSVETNNSHLILLELSNNYVEKTDVVDNSARIRLQAEMGRKMGEIIVRNNISKPELLETHKSEGMFLALAYSIQFRPEEGDVSILNKIAKLAVQPYTKYAILIAYDTLARNSFLDKQTIPDIYILMKVFRKGADKMLNEKIDKSVTLLDLIDPHITG
ncbi:MAG TPA: YEATS-associated helix-containing protein [Edaphocola sp.]|nr:YEATS-associated helix-containing protein [Edaphocola sp.]